MISFRMLGSVELRDSQGRELDAILRRPKLLALLGYLARGASSDATRSWRYSGPSSTTRMHETRSTRPSTPCDKRWGARCCGPVVKKRWGPGRRAFHATSVSSRRRSRLDRPSRRWSCIAGVCSTASTCRRCQSSSAGSMRSGNACAGARARGPSSSSSGTRRPGTRWGRHAGRSD